MGAQGDPHVHGLVLADPQVLLLDVRAPGAQGALDGAPGREVALLLEELDLVGGAELRVAGADGHRVGLGPLCARVPDGDRAVHDVDRGGVPHGGGVGIVLGGDLRGAVGHRDGLLVTLGVCLGRGDPAGRRSRLVGDVDGLDARVGVAEELARRRRAPLDGQFREEVAVDGEPHASGVGGVARGEGHLGEVLVSGVLAPGVGGQGEGGPGVGAVRPLGARRAVGGAHVLDPPLLGVLSPDLPHEGGDGRGVERGPVGGPGCDHEVGRVAPGLGEGRVQVGVAGVVDAAVGGVVAGEEAVYGVPVVDEHLHAAGPVDVDEVEGVGPAVELVGGSPFGAGVRAQARPDGGVPGAGVLGRGVEDGALPAQEGQVRAPLGDDELGFGLTARGVAGPRLGQPQGGPLHRRGDGVEGEGLGVRVPDGHGGVDVLSGDDPVLVLVGARRGRGGRQGQRGEGEHEGDRPRWGGSCHGMPFPITLLMRIIIYTGGPARKPRAPSPTLEP